MSKLQNTIVANVNAACAADVSRATAVEALRKALKGKDADAIRAAILAPVAAFYEVPLVQGSDRSKAKGKLTLDRDAKGYEAAKRQLSRLTADILRNGADKPKADDVEVPEELIAAARKLAKLAQQYEGARSLANKALALAFAK